MWAHVLVEGFGDELPLAVNAGVGALASDLLLLLGDAAGGRRRAPRVQRTWKMVKSRRTQTRQGWQKSSMQGGDQDWLKHAPAPTDPNRRTAVIMENRHGKTGGKRWAKCIEVRKAASAFFPARFFHPLLSPRCDPSSG